MHFNKAYKSNLNTLQSNKISYYNQAIISFFRIPNCQFMIQKHSLKNIYIKKKIKRARIKPPGEIDEQVDEHQY